MHNTAAIHTCMLAISERDIESRAPRIDVEGGIVEAK
jgi:hypothetical protein